MFHRERQLLLFNTPTCQAHTHTHNKTKPYRLVLCDNILENRDLVEADWVAFIIKDHKTSVRCVVFDVLRGKSGRKKRPVDSSPKVEPRVDSLTFTLSFPVILTFTRLFPVGSKCFHLAASVRHASEKSSKVLPKKRRTGLLLGSLPQVSTSWRAANSRGRSPRNLPVSPRSSKKPNVLASCQGERVWKLT